MRQEDFDIFNNGEDEFGKSDSEQRVKEEYDLDISFMRDLDRKTQSIGRKKKHWAQQGPHLPIYEMIQL